jgi:hypothetical protein
VADDATAYTGPKRTRGDSGPKRAGSPKPPRDAKKLMPIKDIRDNLKTLLTGAGMLLYAKDQVDGTVIIGSTPDLVDAWCDMAEHNAQVHKVLSFIASGGEGASIITATLVPLMAIAKHHGRYAGPLLVSIETLEQRALSENPNLGVEDFDETDDDDLDTE